MLQPSKQLLISMSLVIQCLYPPKLAAGWGGKKEKKPGPNGEIRC